MAVEKKRAMVMLDASREVGWCSVEGVLQGFSLKSGDKLTVLAVLQHLPNNPSSLSLNLSAPKFLGNRQKGDSSSSMNQKSKGEESARKEEEYHNNEEIMRLSNICRTKMIEFRIEVRSGVTPKKVAVEAAIHFNATWVILDRHMKRDKKYFLERLSCGISKMKRDNSFEMLRGPKLEEHVTYDEMIPGSPEGEAPQNKFQSPYTSSSIPQASTCCEPPRLSYKKSASLRKFLSTDQLIRNFWLAFVSQEEKIHKNALQETAASTRSPFLFISNEEFKDSICSKCNNKRPKIGWPREFKYAELYAATNGFCKENFLSEGGFGSVFRGNSDGMDIAVKQHKLASSQGEKEFKAEVRVLSQVRHENLVMLLGYCIEGAQRLLVYEYVCNGSLETHISRYSKSPLSWEKRMKIARGAAKGLQYLHENNFIHRDMRPNNILITHDHESRLGDFGLARTQHEDTEHSMLETGIAGTLGYMAPEYAECGKVSTKTDVYAFGVVMLQLITGMSTTDKIVGGSSLVGWAKPLLKERNYPDLIDPGIADSYDFYQLFWMVQVAERCLRTDSHKRLTMVQVVDYLNYILDDNSICGIKDLSPAESDSGSSIPDTNEPQAETTSLAVESEPLSSIYARSHAT